MLCSYSQSRSIAIWHHHDINTVIVLKLGESAKRELTSLSGDEMQDRCTMMLERVCI